MTAAEATRWRPLGTYAFMSLRSTERRLCALITRRPGRCYVRCGGAPGESTLGWASGSAPERAFCARLAGLCSRRLMTVALPSFRLQTVCIDCADAHVMADFYGRLLGWEVTFSEPHWVLMRNPSGGTGLSFQAESAYREPNLARTGERSGQDAPPGHQGGRPRSSRRTRPCVWRAPRRVPAARTSARDARPCWPSVLPLSRLTGARQNCRSALDLRAPNARTERHQMSAVGRALSAHMECPPSPMLKICGTAGPSSGNLFHDLEGEPLFPSASPRGWLFCPSLTTG